MKQIVGAFLFLFSAVSIQAQNLFDAEHTVRYAKFLYVTGQYSQAAAEYERAIFLLPPYDSLSLSLIKCYRKGGQYNKALERSNQLFSTKPLPAIIGNEYAITLILKHSIDSAANFIEQNVFTNELKKQELKTTCLLYQLKLEEVKKSIVLIDSTMPNSPLLKDYKRILSANQKISHKSPFLAGALSTVIPGLGKVYTKDYKDAIFSFLLTVGPGLAAYRGFTKNGVNSGLGWIYGAAATGFYFGNIYGAYKAAKVYNHKKKDKIINEVEATFKHYND